MCKEHFGIHTGADTKLNDAFSEGVYGENSSEMLRGRILGREMTHAVVDSHYGTDKIAKFTLIYYLKK